MKRKFTMLIKKSTVIIVVCFLFAAAFFISSGHIAWASDPINLNQAKDLGLATGKVTDLRILILNIVKYLLTFIGLIAVVFVMWAGFLWMTSEGDPAKIDKAKKTLVNAVIGVAIIISAFAIVLYVNKLVTDKITDAGGSPKTVTVGPGLSAAGGRVIESTYPERDQTNVPRNTKIVVTFKEPIDPTTIIADTNGNTVFGDWIDTNSNKVMDDGEYDKLIPANVSISQNATIYTGPWKDDLYASVSADKRTFVFAQVAPYIGSPSVDVKYSVYLTTNIKKGDGTKVWNGAGGGYLWSFETGTVIDTVPPKIESVIPYPGNSEPRNVILQINFNEGINPITVSNSSISVTADGSTVAGSLYVSNSYATIEFLTDVACGTNSCGQTVYCLPGPAKIAALIKAATPGLDDGITDLAGNSFDGNGDGTASGSLSVFNKNDANAALKSSPEAFAAYASSHGDDYSWNFTTTNDIILTAPTILSVAPGFNALGVNSGSIPTADFDRVLMKSSVTKNTADGSGSVALYASSTDEVDFWLNTSSSTISIKHEKFKEEGKYTPEFNSGIKDIYQNCYQPSSGKESVASPMCTPTKVQPYCCNGALSAVSCKP
jgi:hypothetical protein